MSCLSLVLGTKYGTQPFYFYACPTDKNGDECGPNGACIWDNELRVGKCSCDENYWVDPITRVCITCTPPPGCAPGKAKCDPITHQPYCDSCGPGQYRFPPTNTAAACQTCPVDFSVS